MFQTTKADCEEIMKADKWCANLRKSSDRTVEVYTIECETSHPDFSEAKVILRKAPGRRVTINLFVETDEGREPIKRLDYDPSHPNIPKYDRIGVSPTLHQVVAPNREGESLLNPEFLNPDDLSPWTLLQGFLKEIRVDCPGKKLQEWYPDLYKNLFEASDGDQ